MKRKKGILAALDTEMSLEDKIALGLHEVLSDDSLKNRYKKLIVQQYRLPT